MSSTRTQIYLTDEQRRRIDRVAAAKGMTMAEVVRRAVDDYLDDEPDPERALAATFGLGNFTNGYGKDGNTGREDLGSAKYFLFLGTNQAETHPVTFAYLLRAREKTRARLVVVDPRLTPTGAQADDWVAGPDWFAESILKATERHRQWRCHPCRKSARCNPGHSAAVGRHSRRHDLRSQQLRSHAGGGGRTQYPSI